MATKPKLSYRVVTGKKPGTTVTIKRPQIVGRETYYIDQTLAYALDSGYIRGQFEDSKGTINGFIEACKALGQAGKAVNVANWFRIHAELTGQVGDDNQLTEANELHVNITALTDLKADVNDFSWSNVDDTGVKVKVETILTNGGTPGEIQRGESILATGRNLQFDATLGDADSVTYAGLATPIALTPTESDYAHQAFAWPAALDDVPEGTILVFTFKSRGGVEGAPDQSVTKTAVLKGAIPATPELTSVQQGDRAAGICGFGHGATYEISLNGTIPGGFKSGDALRLDGYESGSTEVWATMNATSYVTASDETAIHLGNGLDNDSPKPDGDWEGKTAKFVLVRDGSEYPVSCTWQAA